MHTCARTQLAMICLSSLLPLAAQAAALAALGVRRGDRVLLLAGNRPEVLVLLGAAAWLGAMLVPLNLRLSSAEMAQQARDAAAQSALEAAAHAVGFVDDDQIP